MNKDTQTADAPEHSELHRIRNELYSVTLSLRAVATLLERGEVDRARSAAQRALAALNRSGESSPQH